MELFSSFENCACFNLASCLNLATCHGIVTSSVRNTLFLLALNLRAQTVLLSTQLNLLISSENCILATWSTYFYELHPLSFILKPFKTLAESNFKFKWNKLRHPPANKRNSIEKHEMSNIFLISRILLVYYCKCCSLIDWLTRTLSAIRMQCRAGGGLY